MTVQKFIKYNSLDINGQVLNDEHHLELNVLEKSGNSLIHKDILRHQIGQKQGTVSTKTRSEVRGGGRKPWRQKGTGRARAGSNRSPLWRGGGVTFGPKPRTIVQKLNKKERRLALQTLLYNKRNNISVIDNLEDAIDSPKTKSYIEFLSALSLTGKKTLFVVNGGENNLYLSARNIPRTKVVDKDSVNTYELINTDVILLAESTVSHLESILND